MTIDKTMKIGELDKNGQMVGGPDRKAIAIRCVMLAQKNLKTMLDAYQEEFGEPFVDRSSN